MERKELVTKGRIIIIGCILVAALLATFFAYSNRAGESEVLARVNGQAITLDYFLQEKDLLQESDRDMIMRDPGQFLEHLIVKELLLQEAGSHGFEKGRGESEEDLIERFLNNRFSTPPEVSEEDVLGLYEAFKSEFSDVPFEEAKVMIENWIMQLKYEEEYMEFLEEIRSKADVQIDFHRLESLSTGPSESSAKREKLQRTLGEGRPVLVNFDSDLCITCQQLRPVIEEIRLEKEGVIEIVVIDVQKHPAISREYRIRSVPTLLFFDAGGKEVFRTQGFLPKEALLEHLERVGVV